MKRRSYLVAMTAIICLIGVFVYVGTVFVPVRASSASMAPTVLPGDWVMVRRATMKNDLLSLIGFDQNTSFPASWIEPGTVVLYEPRSKRTESDAGLTMKRVVAVPGDTLERRKPNLFINGDSLQLPGGPISKSTTHTWGPVQIPEKGESYSPAEHSQSPLAAGFLGENDTLPDDVSIRQPLYFVVGDNPEYSVDSRDIGLVSADRIQAIVRIRLLSSGPSGIIWGRTLRGVWFPVR